MEKIELIKIDTAKQYCISLYNLKKLGYGYPEKGTMVYVPEVFNFFLNLPKYYTWERFYEPDEKNEVVWVSMFGTNIGKRWVSDSNCFITIEDMSKVINKKEELIKTI